jgi:TDG/mug DNA glycosylase family protein
VSTSRPSPLSGERPSKADLAAVGASIPAAMDDLLPAPGQPPLRLLVVGINPGLWSAAVNAPFARPGNRFWPSLYRAGLTTRLVDASRGLSDEDEADLLARGIGVTNVVRRATARADQLGRDELRDGGRDLIDRVRRLRPATVAIAGITVYRSAFRRPKARTGLQSGDSLPDGWLPDIPLWVVPQPSGLNAHETVDSLADRWREVWAGMSSPGTGA